MRITIASCFLLASFCAGPVAEAQVNVATQHNNLSRTGWNDRESSLTTSNVSNGTFGKLFTRNVDDEIWGQPLVRGSVTVKGKRRNVVYVGTVSNTLYAFDADDSSEKTPLWQSSLTYNPDGQGKFRPLLVTDLVTPCGANHGIGITSTPVMDTVKNILYVVSKSISTDGAQVYQQLYAINALTGQNMPGSPTNITATIPGTGSGSINGLLTFDPRGANQRAALLLYSNTVYITWASWCDQGDYHGWVMGYDATSLQQKYVYNDTKDGVMGGIWMSGQAPAVDDDGNIYLSTGNGSVGLNGNANDTANRSESFLKMSVKSGQLKVIDFFTPNDYDYLNRNDLDYGINGVLLLPGTHLSLSGSKESYLYLIDNNRLGGMRSDNSSVLQLLNVNATQSNNNNYLHGSPVYYRNDDGQEYVYSWAEGGMLKQFPFQRSNLRFDTLNKKVGLTAVPNVGTGSMMSVSSNGGQPGSAILWATHNIFVDSVHNSGRGMVQAFDANDVTKELWNSNMMSQRDNLGVLARFASPTVANGKLYVSSFSARLSVYGLNPPAASTCAAALPAIWKQADIGLVSYPGDVCDSAGTFTFSGSGTYIGQPVDGFHYMYQPVTSSFDIRGRVIGLDETSTEAKAGLMIRTNPDPGAPAVFLGVQTGGRIIFQVRSQQNTVADSSVKTGYGIPQWLRITGKGNKYTGYVSTDSINWTPVDSVTLSLGASALAGAGYTSGFNTLPGNMVIGNISIRGIDSLLNTTNLDFTGRNMDNRYALLTWHLAHLSNGAYFEIQRSTGVTQFESIGQVKASSVQPDYNFSDSDPLNGINVYRLKLVYNDSSVAWSRPVQLSFNLDNMPIFPVPASTVLYVVNNKHFTHGKPVTAILRNTSGRVIFRTQLDTQGESVLTVSLTRVRVSGMYFLEIINEDRQRQDYKVLIRK